MNKLILSLVSLIFLNTSFAQQVNTEKKPDEIIENAEDKFESIKLIRLKRIRKEMVSLESKIYLNKKVSSDEDDLVLKLKNESEFESLQKEYNQKKKIFIETATGVTLGDKNKESKEDKLTFAENIQQVLEPAIKSIKKISERPREIQKMTETIEQTTKELVKSNLAKLKLEKLYRANKHKELKRTLQKSIKTTDNHIKGLDIVLEDSQFRLLKLEKEKGSIVTTFSILIFDFLKTKGKNLILALIVFIMIVWVANLGKNRFIQLTMIRIGKNKDSVNQFIWISRPLRVIYTVMTYLASLFMAILTLYVLNDWVLVTFILFILGAVIWSSKQYLPSFVEQSKIVLNLGAIRENERIIFQELPWQIKSLGYYCRLVNPALSGGQLRINTRELLSHHSRPLFDHEPWFPTSSGDWIELEAGDGKIFGKVDLQSPDQVAVKLVGGATKFFQTAEFVKLNPINLSKGYCVEYSFGIDYRHQDIILTKVIPNLRSDVKEMIWDSISHLKEDFEEFSIEFSSANESSLDFRFFLKCKGSIASQKQSLERKTQSIIVEVCNKYQYVIPFNQLTVHLNKDEEK